MAKRCIYCSAGIDQDSVVDMCQSCMHKVWGPKMAAAIVESMEKEKVKGNMELGRVSESKPLETKKVKEEFSSKDYSGDNPTDFKEVSSKELEIY